MELSGFRLAKAWWQARARGALLARLRDHAERLAKRTGQPAGHSLKLAFVGLAMVVMATIDIAAAAAVLGAAENLGLPSQVTVSSTRYRKRRSFPTFERPGSVPIRRGRSDCERLSEENWRRFSCQARFSRITPLA